MKHRIRLRSALAATAALALTAFAPLHQVAARDLSIAVQKLPDVMEPVMENSNVNQRIMFSLFDTLILTDYRDGGVLKPNLATSWTIENPRSVLFKLREGVKFHDGSEMTAEDVAWTFSPERLNRNDGSGTVVVKPFLGGIDGVEVVDPYTVRITMKGDDALIARRFASYPAQIESKTAFDKVGDWSEWAKKPVGTGPYKITEFTFGERVVIEAFDNYWGSDENSAAADKVSFVAVPEISTRIAGLRSGQFDMITEVSPDEIEEIENADGTHVAGGPVLNIRGLIYDSSNEVLDDPRIRRALNLAIDRQAIVDGLYYGKTNVPNGWQFEVFGDMYLADRPQPEFDLDKAKALLEEAGYAGEEIIYRSQQGYYTNQGPTAQILVSMWKKAGLNVRLDMKENWGQVMEDTDDRHIFDGSFSAYYPDPVGQVWRRFGPNGSWAQRGIYQNNEAFLALGKVLESNPDTAVRREVFAQLLDNIDQDPHGSILHALPLFYGVRDDIAWSAYPTEYMNLTKAELTFGE